MKTAYNFPKIRRKSEGVEITLDLERYEESFAKAQFLLDNLVMTDMVPYMPMVTATFINMTKARSAAIAGTGKVYAAAPPYGRFLYEGNVMVSPSTGSAFAKFGERKVLVSEYRGRTAAKEKLTYNKTFHPKVTAKWFDAAKRANLPKWTRMVKEVAGDG